MIRRFWDVLLFTTFATLAGIAAKAAEQGQVILTVTGDLPGATEVTLDRAQLQAIGWETISTESPFLQGTHTFTGTPLADLLNHLNIDSGTLKASALNSYSVDIPVSDAFDQRVLLALEHNGQEMRVRDRGPIWIIYPISDSKPLGVDAERRMVWQLKELALSR